MGAAAGAGAGGSPGALCDARAPFGEPRALDELNTGDNETAARLTSNELTIVFERGGVIFRATRSSKDAPFGEATQLFDVPARDAGTPWLSDDELVLFYEIDGSDIGMARRETADAAFGIGSTVAGGCSDPYVVGGANGRLYADVDGELAVAPLTDWQIGDFAPLGLGGTRPTPTADELDIYFGPTRTTIASRTSVLEPFGEPMPFDVYADGEDFPSFISPDRCRLYFDPWFDAYADLYVVERSP